MPISSLDNMGVKNKNAVNNARSDNATHLIGRELTRLKNIHD